MRLSLLAFVPLMASSALAQWAPSSPELIQLGQRAEARAQSDLAEARAWARQARYPMVRLRADGGWEHVIGVRRGMPIIRRSENVSAAMTVDAFSLWPGGISGLNLDGDGTVLALWDGGNVSNGTGEFGSRRIDRDGGSGSSSHGTHVAGTMAAQGLNANARGMSSAAIIWAYDAFNDHSEMAAAAAEGLRVSNHSYGISAGWSPNGRGDGRYQWLGDTRVSAVEDWEFGFYFDSVAELDAIAHAAPYYLVVRSGGNHRNDSPPSQPVEHWVWDPIARQWVLSNAIRATDGANGGFDSLGGWSVAKNVLTVGAVEDIVNGYAGPGSVNLASFSSMGPTDDGRIKPDLVANGVQLYSPSGNGYSVLSGTSMAAPNATGSLGLLIQQQRRTHGFDLRSATLKAVVLNTTREAGGAPGPDYSFGFGLMNARAAAELIAESGTNAASVHEATLSQGATWTLRMAPKGGEPLRATLVWTDPAGTPPTFASLPQYLNPPDLMLVNDLDMRLVGPDGTVMPWVLNPANPAAAATRGDNFRDNVEQILLDAPSAGDYELQVTHKGQLAGGAQEFSVAVVGAQPVGAPISGSLELGGYLPGPEGIELEAIVLGNGDAVLETHPISLGPDGAFVVLTRQRGMLDLRIQGGTWLSRRIGLPAIDDQGYSGLFAQMINGDIDGSNRIDLDDYFALADAYRTSAGDANWDPRADLDGSGFVDLDDYFILADGFRQEGE